MSFWPPFSSSFILFDRRPFSTFAKWLFLKAFFRPPNPLCSNVFQAENVTSFQLLKALNSNLKWSLDRFRQQGQSLFSRLNRSLIKWLIQRWRWWNDAYYNWLLKYFLCPFLLFTWTHLLFNFLNSIKLGPGEDEFAFQVFPFISTAFFVSCNSQDLSSEFFSFSLFGEEEQLSLFFGLIGRSRKGPPKSVLAKIEENMSSARTLDFWLRK